MMEQRRKRRFAKYGLTIADYDRMFAEQEGKCLGCLTHVDDCPRQLLCVDHCHTTGKVRGLLCDKCNKALGALGDNVDTLTRLISYLSG